MALRFTERPGVDIRNLKLSPMEWKVISFVNPKNTIRQIAQATHLSELEMRRVIYSFLQAGLVEITKPVGGSSQCPHLARSNPLHPVRIRRTEIDNL
jgi:hypothetical protein